MSKKELGAFYTTNACSILKGYEQYVGGKTVIDPFAGNRDLLAWATSHNAVSICGCDINAAVEPDIQLDSILTPLNYAVWDIVVTNPPYLLNNKTKNKVPFQQWNAKDLYKASLLSIAATAKEILAIVPSNMFFDADNGFRERFYSQMKIKEVTLFDEQVFDDTNSRVCVFYATRGQTTELFGQELYKTQIAKDWQILMEQGKTKKLARLTLNQKPTTKICISCTDTGKKGGEIKAYLGEPFYGKISDRNLMTVQLTSNSISLTEPEQLQIITQFNERLNKLRRKYDSMFLTNFLPGRDGTMRKRIAFRQALCLINILIKELKHEDVRHDYRGV